jgi:uncharacterized protein
VVADLGGEPHIPWVVLDTNVFVAAGFRPGSSCARLIESARRGEVRLVWNEDTLRETRRVVSRIPRIRWDWFEDVFLDENCWEGHTGAEELDFIPDPEDRKFLALAEATGATLVTSDHHLLDHRDRAAVPILTPGELRFEGGSPTMVNRS